jgi:hypothetical protein
MSYKTIGYLGLIFLLLCGGCGLKEGVVQKESKSFLWFTGNTQNAIAYIDNLAPIDLNNKTYIASDEEENNTNRSKEIHYQISPGKYTIVIKRAGVVVVNRTILLGNGITKEIQIP